MSLKPVALVTAGSAGLGAAASRLFAKNGYRVIVNYSNNKARADALLEELNSESSGGLEKHTVIRADLSKRAEVEQLVQQAQLTHGRLDVIFSNGGWSMFRDTSKLSDNAFDDDWDFSFAMNVKSHVWLLHAAETFLAAAEGCFITTASMAGVNSIGSSLSYSATKAAQIHMVRGLASMVSPKIRVNSVSPSLMETEWTERFTEEQKKYYLNRTKLKRFITVEDVAEQVLGLAKNRSMTGVNIIIDSGFSLP